MLKATLGYLTVEIAMEDFPPRLGRDEKGAANERRVVGPRASHGLGTDLGDLFADDAFNLGVELVAGPFEDLATKDELLELGGVHLAAQDVGR